MKPVRAYAPLIDQDLEVVIKDGICYHDSKEIYAIPLGDHSSSQPNTSILPEGFQFVWDSVSLGHLKACPYKYKLSVRDGWTFKTKPPKMAFGIAFHTLQQTFHTLIAHEMPRELAITRCVKLAGLLGKYIPEGFTSHTRETLTRAFVWYHEHFQDDPSVPVTLEDGMPAVELDTRFPFVQINGIQTFIVVHLDLLVSFHGGIYFQDYKTTAQALTARFFDKFVMDNQMGLYHLAASVRCNQPISGGIIDAIQVGVNYARFHRSLIDRTPAKNQDFIEDTEKWLHLAHYYATNDCYPQNEASCDHYGGCQFRDICKHARRDHHLYLNTQFRKSTWDPAIRRA